MLKKTNSMDEYTFSKVFLFILLDILSYISYNISLITP
ncbi:hypothetical protein SAMN06265349_101437 [Flavobacterium resistens]|uniref:Uncharacterized protein n=1 Tax=Flavobacterium resistens TaxID=443612 RepID=A0A521AVP5_9FLAO|nr:hypothetical protein SAMN06265349_101437 [Flavobacterium resistens]